jgi:superoxide dismutase, Fe-Mn family
MKDLRTKIDSLENQLQENKKNRDSQNLLTESQIKAEKLPYSYSSLKSFIDPETMDIHYNKHYKGYIDKLNNALSDKESEMSLEQIVKTIERFNKTIRDNAGGAYNHSLFWKMLSPKPMTPRGFILKKIKQNFGSFAEFKKKFEAQAKSRFGSGWVWLVLTKRGTLKIMTTPNQDNPIMDVVKQGGHPLLGLDLWEHAYYLKYRNKRDEYIKNFWKVVNWNFVEDVLQKQTNENINESVKVREFLTEATKSEPCSSGERNLAKELFNQNRSALKLYKEAIMQILKDVYPNKYYEKGEYAPNQLSGIYNLESKGRSIINYLNTNYSAFCVLKKDLNKYLAKVGEPVIDFQNKNFEQQVQEMMRMLSYINSLKFRIFSTDSQTLQTIINVMGKTHEKGGKTEDIVTQKLKNNFGDENVKRIGELGSKEDMMGVDMKIIIDGKEYTAQVKPFSQIENVDDSLKISGTANVKKYNTDWMIFLRAGKDLIIFDNKNTEIKDGVYYFPKDSVLYQF